MITRDLDTQTLGARELKSLKGLMTQRIHGQPLLLAAFLFLLSTDGCRCGQSSVVVARLLSHTPVTDLALRAEVWTAAADGAQLHLGDALRTGASGQALLEISGHGRLKISPRSLVRFTSLNRSEQGGHELRLAIETGALEVTVGALDEAPTLVIDGPTGRLRLGRGSESSLAVEGRELRLNLTVGRAELEEGGSRREILPGEELVLRIGVAGELLGSVASRGDAGAAETGAPDAQPSIVDAVAQAAEDQRDETVFLDGAEGVPIRLAKGASLELRAPGEEEFAPLKGRGASIAPGTTVRVTGSGLVELVGPQGAVVKLFEGASGVVLGSGGGRLRVRLQGGRGEAMTTGGGTASLSMPGGSVDTGHVGPRAVFVAAVIDARSSKVNVTSGVALVQTGGETKQAETGEEVTLRVGRGLSILAPREVQPSLRAGSAVVHDPERSGGFTARFPPVDGCKLYALEVQARGATIVSGITSRPWFALDDVSYGEYSWTARCHEMTAGAESSKEVREGRVVRVADRSGFVQIPTKAPRNSLETSGRQYTVLYQNRLPEISLRWSEAPEASSYRLEVRDEASGKVLHQGRHSRPANSFRSGFFRDGAYYWFFRAEGQAKNATSPVTKVRISFDNVFPAIYIAEPQNGASAAGSVRTRGTTAVGSSVQVNGVQLELGSDYRFDQQVPVGPGGLLVYRVTTPGRGTGLYLRHLSP